MAVLALVIGLAVAGAGWFLRAGAGQAVPGFDDADIGLLLLSAGVLVSLTALFAHFGDRGGEDDPSVRDALMGRSAPDR